MGKHKTKKPKNHGRKPQNPSRNVTHSPVELTQMVVEEPPAVKNEEPTTAISSESREDSQQEADVPVTLENPENTEKIEEQDENKPPVTMKVENPDNSDENEQKMEVVEQNPIELGTDCVDGARNEEAPTKKRKNSEISEFSNRNEHRRSDETTKFDWDKQDKDVDAAKILFHKSYNRKFITAINIIDPEFRFAAGIGPCDTFDADGLEKLFSKLRDRKIGSSLPFDDSIEATTAEIRVFLSEVLNIIKLCLRVACAKRGFDYCARKFANVLISTIWKEKLDAVSELKTIKLIMEKFKISIGKEEEDENSNLWKEVDLNLDVILPAVENSDSKILAENNVEDLLETLYGRINFGFEVTENEVDEMLEKSLQEDGFGEFPSTVLYAPSVFQTVKQLKLIHGQLERMSSMTDIRVKHAGIQAICRIFENINEQESLDLTEELWDSRKNSMEKMLNLNLANLDFSKRVNYLKTFFVALRESPREEFEFDPKRLSAALQAFYIIFPASEVNELVIKLLGKFNQRQADKFQISDRQMLRNCLLSLPPHLKSRLEIGPEYFSGEVSENPNSMYYVIRKMVEGQNSKIAEEVLNFFEINPTDSPLFSVEKVMRMCMEFVGSGKNLVNSAETLNLLNSRRLVDSPLPNEFFDDLLILALSKYSVPEENKPAKRYAFIVDIIKTITNYKKAGKIVINEEKVAENWVNMSHPWFSVVYLTSRFEILRFATPMKLQFPWLSTAAWEEGEKDETDWEKYQCFARIMAAWPDDSRNTNTTILENSVRALVPPEINRINLYTIMKKYISETSTVEENWKKSIAEIFELKLQFLSSHKTPEIKTKDVFEFPPENSENTVNSPITSEIREEILVPDEKKEEESAEQKEAEPTGEQDDTPPIDPTPTPADQSITEIPNSEENPVETGEYSGKPLGELSEKCFFAYYPPEKWDTFEDRIKDEIVRQRKLNGYSNEL